MAGDTKLLAVLIDADNTSPKYAKAIFEEISGFGEASVRRCYGDFSSSRISGWSERIASFGLVPHHQPANTVGKNASDVALVIDAMDLLHTGRFDGYVLVSSDSDFTRLASRIREQGLDVYGIGEKKTPDAFRQACKRFIFVENLTDAEEDKTEAPKPTDKMALNRAYQLVRNVIQTSQDPDGWAAAGWIGQQLVQRYPDFDQRSFGFAKLTELIRATGKFEETGSGSGLRFRLQVDVRLSELRLHPLEAQSARVASPLLSGSGSARKPGSHVVQCNGQVCDPCGYVGRHG